MVYMQGTTVLLQVFEMICFSSGMFDLKRKKFFIFSYTIGIFTKGISRIIIFNFNYI